MASALDIVFVNWNSGGLVRRAVSALTQSQSIQTSGESGAPVTFGRIVVVDNASHDGSGDLDDLSETLPLTIIRNSENAGFGRACNQGAAAGTSPYILFLNPDVVAAPRAIAVTCRFLANGAAERIGVVGAKLADPTGHVHRSTSRFPTPWAIMGQAAGLDRILPSVFPPAFRSDWDHGDTRDVDQIMGAFLMIRRDAFEAIGGFDERFFVYFDDVDLCFRMRQAGWRCVHFAGAEAVHEGEGTTRQVKDIRLFYLLRSRLLYARKHFSRPGQVVTFVSTLGIEPIARAALLVGTRAPRQDLAALFRAYGWLFKALPRLSQSARAPITARPIPRAPGA